MDIVSVSTVAEDVIIEVNALPKEDGFALIKNTQILHGGSGANVIVQASKVGASCGFIAQIGNDNIGKKVLEGFKDENIDTSFMKIKEGGTSLHTQIVVGEEGKKFILLNMGDCYLDLKEEDVNADYIKEAKVFYTDLVPKEPAIYGLKKAKEAGLKTVFNLQVELSNMKGFGVEKEEIIDALKYVDVFAPNRQAFYELTGKDNYKDAFKEMEKHYKGLIILTLGSKGSVTIVEGEEIMVPPYDVEVKDTTGAGDSYLGAFITAYFINKMDLKKSMEFATVCAALTCSKIGARSGPYYEEVNKIMQR